MNRRSRAEPGQWGALVPAIAALALWAMPLPPEAVERWYARGPYLLWERTAVVVTNLVPMAFFDVLVAVALFFLAIAVARARRRGWRAATATIMFGLGMAALWFQLAWGLNYRRLPIAAQLGLAADATDGGALDRFGPAVADAARASADQLHRDTPPTPARALAELSSGFARVQRRLALAPAVRPARPKHSLLDPYFRWAAIDGMTNPFVSEVLVVSNLTPAEHYMTVAHEWGHLAGYASEDEASFVGWLICLEAGGGARYNAWLFALSHAAQAAPQERGREWLRRAGPVVAADLAAIRSRYEGSSPAARAVATAAYDRYLRANRVSSGVKSYDQVLRLMLAAGVAITP